MTAGTATNLAQAVHAADRRALDVACEPDVDMARVALVTGSDDALLNRALLDVLAECESAEAKHGRLPFDPFQRLSILLEEVGEASKATNEHLWTSPNAAAVRNELVQVASVALRMVVAHDLSTIVSPRTK